jgi:MFS family permease
MLLAMIFFLAGIASAGIVLHLLPMLVENGFDARGAARIAASIGIALIIGRILIGFLLDRMPATRLGAMMFGCASLACLAYVIGGAAFAPVMVIGVGLMIGAEFDLMAYLSLRYYPLADYSLVYGWLYSLLTIGSMLSPWTTGYLHSAGGYHLMFLVTAMALAVVACMLPLLEIGKGRAIATVS